MKLIGKILVIVLSLLMLPVGIAGLGYVVDLGTTGVMVEALGSSGGGSDLTPTTDPDPAPTPTTPVGSGGDGQQPTPTPSVDSGGDGQQPAPTPSVGSGGDGGQPTPTPTPPEESDKGDSSPAPSPGSSSTDTKPSDNITNVKQAVITIADQVYTGGSLSPDVKVMAGDKQLVEGYDYTIEFYKSTDAGIATAYIQGIGEYSGIVAVNYRILKADNDLSVTVKTPVVKAAKLKKGKISFSISKLIKVKKAEGKVTYIKTAGNKKISISKTGKVTLKKGLKKGTYELTVKIRAAGTDNYKSRVVVKTVQIKVK